MNIIIQKMTEQEYHDHPALNSTRLMKFNDCPARVLMSKEPKSCFIFGHAFEELCRETWTGPNGFWERYFVSRLHGSIPERLVKTLDAEEDLSMAYVLKGDGTRNDKQKNFHAWLDECLENPGKIPLSQDEYSMLLKMVANLGQAPAFNRNLDFPGITVAELLVDAEWQVPAFWESQGIQKKALFDAVATLDSGHVVIVDLKAMASIGKFVSDYKASYWIQDRHYCEAAWNTFGADVLYQERMIFAVAAKDECCKAKCFEADELITEEQHVAYERLCADFVTWEKAGKPAVAWEEKGTINKFWRREVDE